MTRQEIADMAGVSPTTVSNVIHGNTKKVSKDTIKRVQQILDETGYVPNMSAMMLANNQSRIIGMVVGYQRAHRASAIQDPFVNTFIGTVEECAEDANYYMMILTGYDLDKIVTTVRKWNIAGLILLGLEEEQLNILYRNLQRPMVAIDTYMKQHDKIGVVRIDDYDGGRQAAECLLKRGYDKALFWAGDDTYGDHYRWLGFRDVMKEKTGACEEDRRILIRENRKDVEKLVVEKLDQIKAASAIAVASDYFAIRIMNALYDLQVKVPEEVAIIGFDDIISAVNVRPKLSTIRQNIPRKAHIAFENVLSMIKNAEETCKEIVLPVELVERDT